MEGTTGSAATVVEMPGSAMTHVSRNSLDIPPRCMAHS